MSIEKILGIGGSPRKGGNSDIILKQVLKGAKNEGLDTEEVQLRDYQYQPCIGCERCRKDKQCTGLQDGMQLLYPKIIESRGLIMISPTHNYNVTAWIKAFIDRLYCFYNFTNDRPRQWSSRFQNDGRKAIIVVVGEQPSREEAVGLTLEAMRLPIKALGYEIVDELPVIGIFDKGKVKENLTLLRNAEQIGSRLAHLLKHE